PVDPARACALAAGPGAGRGLRDGPGRADRVLNSAGFRDDKGRMSLDIKICGLTTQATLDAALAHGASHVGFIFFAKSPRNIDPAAAGALRQAARGRAS